jgi:hypothetical protein
VFSDKDLEGNEVHEKLAFFREPPTSLAKRCGLLNKPPAKQVPKENVKQDPISAFQAEFVNRFLYNSDFGLGGHNINILYDDEATRYFGPYDFDLSRIFVNGASLEGNRLELESLLRYGDPTIARNTVEVVVNRRAEMTQILNNAMLPKERKDRMLEWLNLYMDTLANFLSKTRHEE